MSLPVRAHASAASGASSSIAVTGAADVSMTVDLPPLNRHDLFEGQDLDDDERFKGGILTLTEGQITQLKVVFRSVVLAASDDDRTPAPLHLVTYACPDDENWTLVRVGHMAEVHPITIYPAHAKYLRMLTRQEVRLPRKFRVVGVKLDHTANRRIASILDLPFEHPFIGLGTIMNIRWDWEDVANDLTDKFVAKIAEKAYETAGSRYIGMRNCEQVFNACFEGDTAHSFTVDWKMPSDGDAISAPDTAESRSYERPAKTKRCTAKYSIELRGCLSPDKRSVTFLSPMRDVVGPVNSIALKLPREVKALVNREAHVDYDSGVTIPDDMQLPVLHSEKMTRSIDRLTVTVDQFADALRKHVRFC